jgi:hypothetical protein
MFPVLWLLTAPGAIRRAICIAAGKGEDPHGALWPPSTLMISAACCVHMLPDWLTWSSLLRCSGSWSLENIMNRNHPIQRRLEQFKRGPFFWLQR